MESGRSGSLAKIRLQFQNLKLQNLRYSNNDVEAFWGYVSSLENAMKKPMFEELSNFIFNILSLPHSSAAAERVFSELKLIKTCLSNRFDLKTVEAMMFCKELREYYC